ncbi:hypothetical protein BDN72DRAFT_179835 [Pluteus cervinus]|uniref:Uncharacterized protein n=1 Tax=Pluteus cervinus TaxID=181527 RepID=A0ACD3AJK6_9AGAR|nr:hypothetical protein BDN72DRAFT_179835 [Pluteus cervinus]
MPTSYAKETKLSVYRRQEETQTNQLSLWLWAQGSFPVFLFAGLFKSSLMKSLRLKLEVLVGALSSTCFPFTLWNDSSSESKLAGEKRF